MALSTSSFEERSICLFVLVAFVVLAGTYINNVIPDPQHVALKQRETFWQHKVYGLKNHAYNIIATGDSRVYRGFSPEIVEQVLSGDKVLNYGFSSGGHNPFIFRQLEKLLVQSGPRAIILGISPYSLTPKAQQNGAYEDYFRKGPPRWDDSISDFFRALTTDRLKDFIRGPDMTPSNGKYEYLENGYVRSDWLQRDPGSELKVFETDFDGNAVDPKVIKGLIDQTLKWTSEGIKVIGYRPPTTPKMEAVEAAHSGFDETSFVSAFRKAGGIWVDPGEDFTSYDGSHLTPESTDKLSKILAQTIAGAIKSP